MLQSEYWISEIATLSGVSTRTIRYYIQEGLLPRPVVRGKYAVFTEEYVLRLQLIKVLKEAYLPLNKIRELLNILPEEQLQPLLEKFENDPVKALESLQALPVFSNSTPQMERNQNRPIERENSAIDYIKQVRGQKIVRETAQSTYKKDLMQAKIMTAEAENPVPEEWLRIPLVPGLEFHVRQPAPAKVQRLVRLLLEMVKSSNYNQ